MKRGVYLIILTALVIASLAVPGVSAQDSSPKVVVMTPWLAQPGTQLMVDAFQSYVTEKGWDVQVIDTAGDVSALISRMEDVALQDVDPRRFRRACKQFLRQAFRSLAWTRARTR